jgi:hypothetical protein
MVRLRPQSKKGLFMKKIFFILILVSSNVFACPELTGKYICIGGDDPYKMDITQVEENEVTIYNITNDQIADKYIADGIERPHSITVQDMVFPGTLSARCKNDTFVFKFLTKFEGKDIDFSQGFTYSEDGKLEVKEIIKNGRNSAGQSFVCTRKN